jgi:hypothetical protein
MTHSERIAFLEHSHHLLEKQLGKMQKHPHVDEFKVAEIKKQKLQLKDQIRELREQAEKESND